MAKPVINYKGHMTENPSGRNQVKICIPQVIAEAPCLSRP